MPVKDYIPTKEGDLVLWTENFITIANTNLAALGLAAPDLTVITTKKTDYSTKLKNAIEKHVESKTATEVKNISKSGLVGNIRALARQIQARPGVPNSLKEQLGLNVPGSTSKPVHPLTPVNLTGKIGKGGLANMKWNRNGNRQGTIFIIESSNNFKTGWRIIGTTTKTSYATALTEPKGHNFFRVKAQKSKLASEVSNVIVL